VGFVSFVRDLDTVGDGTGATNGAQNFSASATDFKLLHTGKFMILNSLSLVLQNNNSQFFPTGYGSLAALTNGISLRYRFKGVDYDLLRGKLIKRTSHLMESASSFSAFDLAGGVKDTLLKAVFWFDFLRQEHMVLDRTGDFFKVRLNDDFSGLARHTFTISGVVEE